MIIIIIIYNLNQFSRNLYRAEEFNKIRFAIRDDTYMCYRDGAILYYTLKQNDKIYARAAGGHYDLLSNRYFKLQCVPRVHKKNHCFKF